MEDCIFCEILNGKAEATFVYRDELVSAFMDLYPINEGHVLVIPNKHSPRFSEVDEQTAAHMLKIGQKILKAIQASDLKSEGFNLFISDGEVAGQEPPHTHLHICPRFKADGLRPGFSGANPKIEKRDKLIDCAEIIKIHV